MENFNNQQLEKVLRDSECIISSAEINSAYDRLAAQLNLYYGNLNPIVIVVMKGGLIPAGHLLTKLNFFHRMTYVHATRYHDNRASDELLWKMPPPDDLYNEHVLLIDDIFDEGVTLKKIVAKIKQQQPASLKTCVLLDKQHDRKVKDFAVDFVGHNVSDRYVYGCGMDYHGYLRHLSGIYALKEEK